MQALITFIPIRQLFTFTFTQRVCTLYNCTVHLEGKWEGGDSSSMSNWTQLTSAVQSVTVRPLRDARPAGWVTSFCICVSTMPWAQNRTRKGSILLWRQLTFPIFLLFIYAFTYRTYKIIVLCQICFNTSILDSAKSFES